MATLLPIPHPPGLPLLGNIFDIDREVPIKTFEHFAQQYGEIYSLTFIGRTIIRVNSCALAQEFCDEQRFHKSVRAALEEIRVLTGDALSTAYHGEENWGVAHRVLVPAFGPASIVGMVDDMYDILSQLVLKWERFGPNQVIDPAEDFTRLAFDTIALCSMSYRLNSFYTTGVPPFVEAMASFLTEAGRRPNRMGIANSFMRNTNAKYEEDQRKMLDLARQIVEDRRKNPTDTPDLLNAMLKGRDPRTGKTLSDESIMQQMITFLIAGHETTSGLLSFAMYYILKNPHVYAKLQAEVDAILGSERIHNGHIPRLTYIAAVLRETLRISASIPGFGVESEEDQVVGGKYLIPKNTLVFVTGMTIHRDPEVWGDDADEFKPERMMDGKFEALPPKAWVPFGNGARACIGRGFAWQEAVMAIATLFQKFDFRLVDPNYTLDIKQTLTLKPKTLRIHAIPRTNSGLPPSVSPTAGSHKSAVAAAGATTGGVNGSNNSFLKPMHVLYGGNTGSCEMFAQRIATAAPSHGFTASIGPLDSITQTIPTNGPVVIVTASFEGQPADNAGHFVKHVETAAADAFAGVKYVVFGCGNREWVHTYQRIPTLVDTTLTAKGAERLLERGETDAGGERFFDAFDEWEVKLWTKLVEAYGAVASLDMDVGVDVKLSAPTSRASTLRQEDVQLGTVIANNLLTKPGAMDKHHLEIKLPENVTYRAGDYLAVLPSNPAASVKRVLSRFHLTPDQELTISTATPTTLPTNRSVNVVDLFSGYVELAQPATRKNLESLLRLVPPSGPTHAAVQTLIDNYSSTVLEKRLSVLNILDKYPDIELSLSHFLDMLPAMRIRQYSISSSPLWNPTHVTLTLGIIREAALGDHKELFQGVASTYLAGLQPGDTVQVAVRPSSAAFHLPADPKTPIVMFASGSGIAPMRGFLQERAAQKAAGRDVGKALLFYGCRSPELDFLYGNDELKMWITQGVVDVRPAFSRAADKSEGCKYVQDRVWQDRGDVISVFHQGAKFFTCGSLRVASGVKDACLKIIDEILEQNDGSDLPNGQCPPTAHEIWMSKVNERYAADVFG